MLSATCPSSGPVHIITNRIKRLFNKTSKMKNALTFAMTFCSLHFCINDAQCLVPSVHKERQMGLS